MRRLSLALALAAGCSASDDIPSPAVASVTPDHGAPGAVVTIAGSYFCQRPANVTDDPNCAVAGTVHFGTVPATPTDWQDTQLLVEVPNGNVGATQVEVTAAGRTSNSVGFRVD
jgi:uncharacterized protein (TIGR03437 family)